MFVVCLVLVVVIRALLRSVDRSRSLLCFFFKQKTAYEMRISDWSSDVCSSDLQAYEAERPHSPRHRPPTRCPGGRARHGTILGHETAPSRSEESRVGKESVSPGSSRGSPYH